MPTDLSDKKYWNQRQNALHRGQQPPSELHFWEWMPIVLKFVSDYAHSSFLELGCSPGDVSAAICAKVPLRPEGVDFADTSERYLTQMHLAGVEGAVLHRCDIRQFRPARQYDIVASFGLIEHFTDFETVLDIHNDLLAEDGLCIIEVPNFRRIQYLYHYFVDRRDLQRHNTDVMALNVFETFARRSNHRILHLDYCGCLRFWGVDSSGPRMLSLARVLFSRLVRLSASLVGRILPSDHPYLAPWILYVGQKRSKV